MMYQPDHQGRETPSLEDYLKAVQARKWLVLACAIVGIVLATLFAESRTQTFSSQAVVALKPTPVGSSNNGKAIPNLETESATVRSTGVATQVIDQLNLNESPSELLRRLQVQFEPTGLVLTVTYTDFDAQRSKDVVDAIVQTYADNRTAEADNFYEVRIGQAQAVLDTHQAELDELTATTSDVQRRLNAAYSSPEPNARDVVPELQSTLNSTNNERSNLIGVYRLSQQTLNALQAEYGSFSAPASVLRFAAIPDSANGLGRTGFQLAGLLAGLLLGVSAAFVLDRLDNTAREESDVELAIGSSVLGTVPPFGVGNRSGSSALVMLSPSKSTSVQRAREAFRRLRSSVQFLASTDDIRSIVITSAQPAEGKSVASTNLAISLAQGGATTVLVSADMRRPSIEKLFGITNSEGLSNALRAEDFTVPQVLSVGVENLGLIPSGPSPHNPGELLGSERFADLIATLESRYDYVIVDTPPVLSAADSIAASASVGGVVVLVDGKRTDTEALLKVRSDLERAGARVLGAILNRDKSRNAGFFSRRDRYAYERASRDLVS